MVGPSCRSCHSQFSKSNLIHELKVVCAKALYFFIFILFVVIFFRNFQGQVSRFTASKARKQHHFNRDEEPDLSVVLFHSLRSKCAKFSRQTDGLAIAYKEGKYAADPSKKCIRIVAIRASFLGLWVALGARARSRGLRACGVELGHS